MMHSFPELTIGGVLVAPFVIYAGAAIAISAVLRPVLPLRPDPHAANRAVLKGGILAVAKLHPIRPNNVKRRRG
jgi:hypothetical protein